MTDPVEQIRSTIQHQFRRVVADGEQRDQHLERADDGLFGPDSMVWVVHGDISTLVGGLRSLFLQSLHPLTAAGVYDHSNYHEDPLGRLHRTGQFIGATSFGSVTDAERSIKLVHNIHKRVTGTAPDGREYEANDPHLLEWVHITEVDSFLRSAIAYGPVQISRPAADKYVDEMAEIALRLGVDGPPRSFDELTQRLTDYRPELALGAQGRDIVRFLLNPGIPIAARPLHSVITAAAIGMLPRWARRMLWLPLAPGTNPLMIRPAALALLRTLGWALDVPDDVAEARKRLVS
ncbi:MAG: oxygenase MpaB family protein [Acidimicrobiales bacterium]